jgi:hypothetical protein
MDEQPETDIDCKSYPVKIIAIKMDWILNDKAGKEFLYQILLADEFDYFSIPTVETVIEFLTWNIKHWILATYFPLFLL